MGFALSRRFVYILADEDFSIAMDGDEAGPRPRAVIKKDIRASKQGRTPLCGCGPRLVRQMEDIETGTDPVLTRG